MSVVSLHGQDVHNPRRDTFLNEMSAMFDAYVADYEQEPEAFAIVFGGVRQSPRASWFTQGDTEGAALSFLALATVCMINETVHPD